MDFSSVRPCLPGRQQLTPTDVFGEARRDLIGGSAERVVVARA
jgi:hypothetical protein